MIKKILKTNNIFSFGLFIVLLIFVKPGDKVFSDIVTFISIGCGFSITSLSIIATSPFSRKLYLTQDPKDNSRTLLHILVGHFKNSIFYFTTTVCLILIYKYVDCAGYTKDIWMFKINFIKCFAGLIWYFTIQSVIRFVFLVNAFANFVLQTAKNG